jgi:tetratricopeptide (TPR) repeat protein
VTATTLLLLLACSADQSAGQPPAAPGQRAAAPPGQDAPATPAARDAATPVAAARALLARDRPRDAIAALEGADESDPRVQLVRGIAHYHAGDASDAVALLEPTVGQLPEGSGERREAVQVLGLSLYLAGRIVDSLPWMEATREWAGSNPELLHILGTAYVQTRQPDKAREALARLFEVAPEGAQAHLLAAQAMIRLEQETLAREELARAVAKDPRIPRAHFLLGQLDLFRARFEEATAATRKEIELNPADNVAWSQLGDIYVRQQRWDEAIAALQRSIWVSPYYSAPYILLGRAYMRKGQPGTAEAMLRRAVEYDPNNKQAHYLLGQVLQQAGRTEEARRELEIAERLQGAAGR